MINNSNHEVTNIWKPYMWTAEWRIKWRMIIGVIYATFAVAKRKPEKNSGLYGIRLIWHSFRNSKSCLYHHDDHPSFNSSLRSSHIWFTYIHDFIIILSRVYNEPIQWPASSWLVSLIGRALHRYGSQVKGSNPVQAWILLRLFFHNRKSCVYNRNDHPSFNSIHDRDVMVTFDANEYLRKMIFQ